MFDIVVNVKYYTLQPVWQAQAALNNNIIYLVGLRKQGSLKTRR